MRKLINIIATGSFFSPFRRLFGCVLIFLLDSKRGFITFYSDPYRAPIFDLIKSVKKETKMLLADDEAYNLYMLVKATQKYSGDIAEVGCYLGGSSKIICEAKGLRKFHIFDTFEGLPSLSVEDSNSGFYSGQFKSSLKLVKKYLKKYSSVFFLQGAFSFYFWTC